MPAPEPGRDIRLHDVTKSYRLGDGTTLTAADHVTLTIAAGDTVALVGPSGSGKSTLLHLIGGLDAPDSGTIHLGDTPVTTAGNAGADYRSRVGFIFQRFHLIPTLTVTDNILAPLVPRKVAFNKRAAADELIAAVGLTGRDDALPHQLSGGQQQRVAIARALVNRPQLLLADEPTGNLDASTAADIIALLTCLNHDLGTTTLIATHDPDIAARCRRTIHVTNGSVGSVGVDPGM